MDWEVPQSLAGYSPWGRKELNTTEQLYFLGWSQLYLRQKKWIFFEFCVCSCVFLFKKECRLSRSLKAWGEEYIPKSMLNNFTVMKEWSWMDPTPGEILKWWRHLRGQRLGTYCLTEVRVPRLQCGTCYSPFHKPSTLWCGQLIFSWSSVKSYANQAPFPNHTAAPIKSSHSGW